MKKELQVGDVVQNTWSGRQSKHLAHIVKRVFPAGWIVTKCGKGTGNYYKVVDLLDVDASLRCKRCFPK